MKHLRTLIGSLVFCLNFALLACLIYLFGSRGYIEGAGFTAAELVTIVLAAVSVLITALGIFIALLAIWGYQSLHATAGEIGEKAAREKAEKLVPELIAEHFARIDAENDGADYGAAATKENGKDG